MIGLHPPEPRVMRLCLSRRGTGLWFPCHHSMIVLGVCLICVHWSCCPSKAMVSLCAYIYIYARGGLAGCGLSRKGFSLPPMSEFSIHHVFISIQGRKIPGRGQDVLVSAADDAAAGLLSGDFGRQSSEGHRRSQTHRSETGICRDELFRDESNRGMCMWFSF